MDLKIMCCNLDVKVDRIKFFGSLLRFQLSIETNDPDYRSQSFTVIRIYKDFVWLDDKLRDKKEYLGIPLPKLPDKLLRDQNKDHFTAMESALSKLSIKSQERFEEEMNGNKSYEMDLCKDSHQRYLDELTSHPILKKDRHFKIFLEYRDLLKGVVKHKKNTLYREMDGLAESCLDNGLDRFRDAAEECLQIRQVIEQHSAVTYSCENLCYSIAGFCIHLDEMEWSHSPLWSLKEENIRANNNIKHFMNMLYLNYSHSTAIKYLTLTQYHAKLEYNDLKHDILRAEKHKHDTTHLLKQFNQHLKHLENLYRCMPFEFDRLHSLIHNNYKSAFSLLSSFQLASSRAMENDLRHSIARL